MSYRVSERRIIFISGARGKREREVADVSRCWNEPSNPRLLFDHFYGDIGRATAIAA